MIAEVLSDSTRKTSMEELCIMFGMTDRAIRLQIARERRAGQPICASSAYGDSGYFLGDTPEEIDRQVRSLGSRIKELQAVQRAMRKTAQKLNNGGDGADGRT